MRFVRIVSALCAVVFGLLVTAAFAWEYTGHFIVSEAGAMSFPPELPAFVRTPEAVYDIANLSSEPDNIKYVGDPLDKDGDPGHYIDVDDDGTVAGLSLAALPKSRAAYDTLLRGKQTDQYRTGFLPYSLMDGWQRLVKDFGYWRVDDVGEKKAARPEDRQFFTAQKRLREMVTLRDIGVWSHFVGDASQPLHASSRFNGWDAYPNSKGIHERFEGPFVRANVTATAVRALIPSYQPCRCDEWNYILAYLKTTNSHVVELYKLGNETNSFRTPTPAALAFTTARVAAGAAALRDMVAEAWRASEDTNVGYPLVKVRDVLDGRVVPTPLTIRNGN